MHAFTWLCTVSAAALSLATTVSAPTRSQYRPKFFENELQTISSAPGRQNASKPAASSSMPSAKPLVGEVEQRQEAAAVDRVGQLLPLLGRRVDAGRVVAAAVEQDDVAGRHLLDRRDALRRTPGCSSWRRSTGKLFVGTPAAAKICGWLGQVGCVSHTVAFGIC